MFRGVNRLFRGVHRVFRGVHMLFTGKVLALQCGVKFIGEGDSVGVGTFHDL